MEQSGQPLFESAEPVLKRKCVPLEEQDWPVGQLFQLLAATLRDEEYLYVFSVDAQREVHFHWPRQASLNEKFSGQNESGLLIGHCEIAIPGATKGLKITQTGTDRLVMLFSKRKIETIQALAAKLRLKMGT